MRPPQALLAAHQTAFRAPTANTNKMDKSEG